MGNVSSRSLSARYARQMILPKWGESVQEKLFAMRVIIAGIGGLGTHVASSLTRLGLGEILLIDNDLVQLSNLHRQVLFDHDDIGKPKVICAQKKLKEINPETQIIPLHKNIHELDLERIIRPGDIIFDCLDSFDASYKLHDHAWRKSPLYFQARLFQFEHQFFALDLEDEHGPCLHCLAERDAQDGCVAVCGEAGISPANAAIAAHSVTQLFINILLGEKQKSILFTQNAKSFEGLHIKIKKNTNCVFNHHSQNISNEYNNLEVSVSELSKSIFQSYYCLDELPVELLDKLTVLKKVESIQISEKTLVICEFGIKSLEFVFLQRENGNKNIFSLKGGFYSLGNM